MHRRRLATVLWVAWLCWAAGILWLSSLTPRELPQAAFLLSDKAEHLIAYAVGGWLAATAIRAGRRTATVAGWFVPAVILVAAFGVLDEATSSVDTRTELLVQQAMIELRRGRTSFIVAHRLSTIRDADLIVVMDGGRIVEQGSHAELLARRGAYWAMTQV